MTDKSEKKHFHHGKSSKDILDAEFVLNSIGLKKGDIFLDAGSGDGYMSLAASKIVGEKGKVYAVEIWEESINILEKEIKEQKIGNIESIIADISAKIPIDNAIIDICYMGNVLHGFVENEDYDNVMKEISRIIKLEGTFAVIEFKKIKNIPGPPFPVKMTPEEVEKIISDYGFEVKEVIEAGKYHYGVISVKK